MKLNVIVVLTAVLLATAGLATAKEGPYAAFSAGLSLTPDLDLAELPGYSISYDPGYAFSAALGGDFRDFSLEGEIGYKHSEADKVTNGGISQDINGSVSNLSFMGNGYINFWNRSKVTPFLMAGVGVSLVTLEADFAGSSISEDEVAFAYQVGGGLSFDLNDTTALSVSYRYFDTPTLKVNGTDVDNANHNMMAGVRFNF
jgi:opacity protein-like surface antigen